MSIYETYRLVDLIHDMHTEGEQPTGICTRYVWSWTLRGISCTRAVTAGKKYGYLVGHFPTHGNASMNLTDKGREYGSEIVKVRAIRAKESADA